MIQLLTLKFFNRKTFEGEDLNEIISIIASSISEHRLLLVDLHFKDDKTARNEVILITECFKILRNICANGSHFQNRIANLSSYFPTVRKVLLLSADNTSIKEEVGTLRKFCLQSVANLCVGNNGTQQRTWEELQDDLIIDLEAIKTNCDISAMILYNMFIGGMNFEFDNQRLFLALLKIIAESENSAREDGMTTNNEKFDFVNIFIEFFLTKYDRVDHIYHELDINERIIALQFALEIIREDDRKRRLNFDILKQIIENFKVKSDQILNVGPNNDSINSPQEISLSLEIIATTSGQSGYQFIYSDDGALFLTVGCLLKSIQSLGSQSTNIFTPLQRLEELAPNSMGSSAMETDISYQFKSFLVRTIGNLSHKNKKMQNLSREMDILLAVLESTNADARNPCKFKFFFCWLKTFQWFFLSILHLQ